MWRELVVNGAIGVAVLAVLTTGAAGSLTNLPLDALGWMPARTAEALTIANLAGVRLFVRAAGADRRSRETP